MNIFKSFANNLFPPRDKILSNLDKYVCPVRFDLYQKAALLSPFLRNVVIAGAGAGKTALVIERAKLLASNGVDPSKLLFITFTRKASQEMEERLENFFGSRFSSSFPKVFTIHRFVNKIEKTLKYGLKPHIYNPEIENDPIRLAWKKTITNLIQKHPSLGNYLYEIYMMKIMTQEGLPLHYVYDFSNILSKYKTNSGIRVRSRAEQKIADFLFESSIEFEYEKPVLFCDWPFRPDFYIKESDMFIEYLGLWNLSNKEERENYRYCVQQKKVQLDKFKFGSYAYLEIYPEDISSGRYKDKIRKKMDSLSKLSKRQKYRLTDPNNITYKDRIDVIVKNAAELFNFIQSNNLSLNKLRKNVHIHFREFIDILDRTKKMVDDILKEQGLVDYKDLFLDLGHNLRNFQAMRDCIKKDFQYVFLDEFQDIQPLLIHFLGGLLDEIPFYAIGDDRQAIYGFAGGTPYFIRNLKSIFPGTKKYFLKYNYRSNKTIVQTSQIFTRPGTSKIYSKDLAETCVVLFEVPDEEKYALAIINKVNELTKNAPLMILSRYKHENIDAVKAYSKFLKDQDRIMTFHSSKGLEEESVLLSNLIFGNDVNLSTPSLIKDHPFKIEIRKFTLQDSPEEEERRLFYVALSRAKKYLFLVTKIGSHSPFLKEIPNLTKYSLAELDYSGSN